MNKLKDKKFFLVVVAAGILILAVILIYFLRGGTITKKTIVIEEELGVPETKEIKGNEGRFVNEAADIPLVPRETEEYVVPGAIFTLKGSYDFVRPEAGKWSSDTKLVFIKSLGAVDLSGKSSQWQIVFGSALKKKGYEFVVRGNAILSQKEIESKIYGYELPQNWYDSDEAIRSLQGLPQFAGHTLDALNFFYNTDAKEWRYALSTSFGHTSMKVK